MPELVPPRALPVANLSTSSVRLFRQCPEKWRRRYIEREYEGPVGPSLIVGKAAGTAIGDGYQQQVDGEDHPPVADVLDDYAGEFDLAVDRDEVDWGERKPGEVKDAGAAAITVYEDTIAPGIEPVGVERGFDLALPNVDWGFSGYLDLEERDGGVTDFKVKAKRLSQDDADADVQPTAYLLYKRAADEPAPEFRFHTLLTQKEAKAEVVRTTRTDDQLDAFVDDLYRVAAEIDWRITTDNWAYAAPGHWVCSERFCGYWHRCPGGGGLRR